MSGTETSVDLVRELTVQEQVFVLGFITQRIDRKGSLRKTDVRQAVEAARMRYRLKQG